MSRAAESKLWAWNWSPDGYNSCVANNRGDALKIATAMAARTRLNLDESSLREVSDEEMEALDRRYASMCG